MKKKYPLLIGLASLLLVALLPASSMAKKKSEPIPTPDWAVLDVAKWDETIYKLIPPPDENGNAIAYFLEATHLTWAGKGEDELKKKYEWWEDLRQINWSEGVKEEQKPLVAKAIQIPEIDSVVKGSRQKNFQWVGVFMTPSADPDETWFAAPVPNYLHILMLSRLVMARAEDKLAKGDKAGAEADMMAAVRVGHLLQKDLILIGYMVGVAVESMAARKMPEFYKSVGNETKAKEWEDLIPLLDKHKDAGRAFMKYFYRVPMEEAARIISDESLPRSMRMESVSAVIGNEILEHPILFMMRGPSKKAKKFVTAEYFDDPEMRILQLKLIEDVYITLSSGKMRRKTITFFSVLQ